MLKGLLSLSALAALVVAQSDSYIDSSLSEEQLLALHDFLESAADYQYPTNITTADNVTLTAEGYILGSTTEPYFAIEWRETQSAYDYLSFPSRNLEVTTYINPVPSGEQVTVIPDETPVAQLKKRMLQKRAPGPTPPPTPLRKPRRDLRARDQIAVDICPVPKTVTVIEWIDCAASPDISVCDVCPATTSSTPCDTSAPSTVTACPLSTASCATCKYGYEVILLGTPGPSDPPCSKVQCTQCENGYKYVVVPSTLCPTTTMPCTTCPDGYQVILLGTPGPYDPPCTREACPTCEGGYKNVVIENNINININLAGSPTPTASVDAGEIVLTIDHGSGYTGPLVTTITALQSVYPFIGTLVVSSNSKLIVSTQYALDAGWSSSLTWPPFPEPTDDESEEAEAETDELQTPTQTHAETCTPPFFESY